MVVGAKEEGSQLLRTTLLEPPWELQLLSSNSKNINGRRSRRHCWPFEENRSVCTFVHEDSGAKEFNTIPDAAMRFPQTHRRLVWVVPMASSVHRLIPAMPDYQRLRTTTIDEPRQLCPHRFGYDLDSPSHAAIATVIRRE